MTTSRDVRIDLIRGGALLIIFVDHFEYLADVRILSTLTPQSWGLSDALEVFVFISGFVFGLSYVPVITTIGVGRCLRKALRRCWTLYVVNACLTVVTALPVIVRNGHPGFVLRVASDEADYSGLVFGVLTMSYQPFGCDILPLYVAMLLIMPLTAWLYTKQWLCALSLSLTVYVLSQSPVVPAFQPFPLTSPWFFNPMAWQLVFFLGVVCGTLRPCNTALLVLRWRHTPLVAAALFLGLTLVWHIVDIHPLAMHLAHKHTAGPIRLMHFCFGAAAFGSWLCHNEWLCHSPCGILLRIVGRQSLAVFSTGHVLVYVGACIFRGNDRMLVAVLAYEVVACMTMVTVACRIAAWRKTSCAQTWPDASAHGVGSCERRVDS